MHVYPITVIMIILLVLLPDIYLYSRFMRNRVNKSTKILHWIISSYFLAASFAIFLNINHIVSPTTHYQMIMFVCVLVMVYATKLTFCTFDLIFYKTGKRWRKIQYAGYGASSLAFLASFYAINYGRFDFQKTEETIEIKGLPDSFDGYKILQMSDLHLGSFAKSQKRLEPLFDSINAQHADIIVFTGDMVNNFATECNGWNYVFDKLQSEEKKLAILGNHDYGLYYEWDDEDLKSMNEIAIRQKIRDFGFELLLNDHYLVNRGEDTIAFIGIENWGTSHVWNSTADFPKAYKGTEPYPVKILLSHEPVVWHRKQIKDTTDIQLTLCGHTHGAQFGLDFGKISKLPILKQLRSLEDKIKTYFICRYWDGLYTEGDKSIYVSRGLGCVGLPARLGMAPQYTVITLKKKNNDEGQ